eukprot:TRINITY_DN64_c0_g2_i1.p1 TRINITY_DN64_c0_g2~~TRINITY_DN64_c0_g2_i1.p1  ORF type:complete len:331 (-),score=38.61 TRINITY_DN64_c0_g2_i1:400-1392(-)
MIPRSWPSSKASSLSSLIRLTQTVMVCWTTRSFPVYFSFSMGRTQPLQVLRALKMNLSEWDIRVIMAMVDKNCDGDIQRDEFMTGAVDLLLGFLVKNKGIRSQSEAESGVTAGLKELYKEEINEIDKVMQKAFKKCDPQGSGYLTKDEFKHVVSLNKKVTTKERNLILIAYMKDEKYYYADFKEHLMEVRCASITSKMADIHLKNIETFIISACEKEDVDKSGLLPIDKLQFALLDNEFLTLSVTEIAMILGVCNPKGDHKINYREFAQNAKKVIGEFYSSGAKNAKALAFYNGAYERHEISDSLEYDEFKLFGVIFKVNKTLSIVVQAI